MIDTDKVSLGAYFSWKVSGQAESYGRTLINEHVDNDESHILSQHGFRNIILSKSLL